MIYEVKEGCESMDTPGNFRNHSLNVHELQRYSWLDQMSIFEVHQDDHDIFEVVHRIFYHLTSTFQDQRLGEKIGQETFDASISHYQFGI